MKNAEYLRYRLSATSSTLPRKRRQTQILWSRPNPPWSFGWPVRFRHSLWDCCNWRKSAGSPEVKVQRLFLLQFVFGLFQFAAVDCGEFLQPDHHGRCVWFGFGKLGELFCGWYRLPGPPVSKDCLRRYFRMLVVAEILCFGLPSEWLLKHKGKPTCDFEAEFCSGITFRTGLDACFGTGLAMENRSPVPIFSENHRCASVSRLSLKG